MHSQPICDVAAIRVLDGAAGKPLSYSEAEQTLSKLKQTDPAKAEALRILRPSDLKLEPV